MPHFRNEHIDLYYETAGQGTPVVFLNGIMMTVASWAYQRSFFRQRYHCIFHDFRDQLHSFRSPAPYTMTTHAADLLALLDYLDIEKAHFVGTSYGGEVGLIFAYTYPERVQSISILASVSYVAPLLHQQVELWQKCARQAPDLLYEALVSLSFSDGFLEKNPGMVSAGAERLSGYPRDYFEAFGRLCDAFLQLDITGRLSDIRCPTLVMAGQEDILKTPAYAEVIRAHIPGAELSLLPGAGHAFVLEQPEAVNQRVAAFLRAHAF